MSLHLFLPCNLFLSPTHSHLCLFDFSRAPSTHCHPSCHVFLHSFRHISLFIPVLSSCPHFTSFPSPFFPIFSTRLSPCLFLYFLLPELYSTPLPFSVLYYTFTLYPLLSCTFNLFPTAHTLLSPSFLPCLLLFYSLPLSLAPFRSSISFICSYFIFSVFPLSSLHFFTLSLVHTSFLSSTRYISVSFSPFKTLSLFPYPWLFAFLLSRPFHSLPSFLQPSFTFTVPLSVSASLRILLSTRLTQQLFNHPRRTKVTEPTGVPRINAP